MSNKDKGIPGFGSDSPRTVNVGYGNLVRVGRIVTVLEANSLPMKRLRERALSDGLLIDATAGRKTRSILVTDSRHVVLSALSTMTLQERLHGSKAPLTAAEWEVSSGEFVS